MKVPRALALPLAGLLLLAACQGQQGGGAATGGDTSPAATTGGQGASPGGSPAAGGDDLLARILEEGVIRVATDPAYPPQSELLPDGTFEGFDIDTANLIAEELGVEVEFVTPNFEEVVPGNWADRWDISVGSVTVTEPTLMSHLSAQLPGTTSSKFGVTTSTSTPSSSAIRLAVSMSKPSNVPSGSSSDCGG